MKKAKIIFPEIERKQPDDISDEQILASRGSLQKFMRRNHLPLGRKTSVAQKDPDRLVYVCPTNQTTPGEKSVFRK